MRRRACSVLAAILLAIWGAPAGQAAEPRWAAGAILPVSAQSTFAMVPIRRGEAGFRALYTMNRDGTNVEYLVAAPGMIGSSDPSWSHDGKMLAFNAHPAIDAVVESKNFVYAVDGPFQGLVRDLGYGNTPDWSLDDRQIAYMINDGNPAGAKGGVWIMDVDGTNRRWFAKGFYPRWSPDGKRLCYHGWLDDGPPSLFVADPATGESRALLTTKQWSLVEYTATWSPEGRRLVFVGAFEGRQHIATVFVNGGESSIRILYTNDDSTVQLYGPPAWSPDGRQILFIKQAVGAQGPRRWLKSYIFSLPFDGSSPPALLEGRPVGEINRAMNWSRDSAKIVFSSER
ncbi:MAG: TolB family protein [Planctomycetaceae bacterium]